MSSCSLLKITTLAFSLYSCTAYALLTESIFINEIKTTNNLQGIFYSSPDKLFTLEHANGKPEAMIFLNKWKSRALFIKDEDIGHQGIGVSIVRERSTFDIVTGEKNSAFTVIYFNTEADGTLINKRKIKVFPDSFSQKNETMPTLSNDGKYLIARGRSSDNKMIIRVFDFKKIINSTDNDFSNNFIFEWGVSSLDASKIIGSLQPLQAIASNGDEVTFLFGNARITPKVIYTYSLDGKRVNLDSNITLGIDEALKHPTQDFYEPEGIAYINKNEMRILITSGKGSLKQNFIYNYQH